MRVWTGALLTMAVGCAGSESIVFEHTCGEKSGEIEKVEVYDAEIDLYRWTLADPPQGVEDMQMELWSHSDHSDDDYHWDVSLPERLRDGRPAVECHHGFQFQLVMWR